MDVDRSTRPDKLWRVEGGQGARGERVASGLAAAPRFLGRYRIVAELARGSTSVVYLGIVAGPGGFNKLFALKQLRAALAEDPANVAMFLAEARLAGRLSHSNVVSTLEIEEDSALPYIVMEYLEGQPLFRAGARARMAGVPLSIPLQLAILSDAVEGLSYAHQAVGYDGAPLCVVHRDVSPHNVFVTYGGQTKLLDFGIAQSREIEGPRTGSPRGKVAYMSPEQAAGTSIDARADIFAIGVMLWEAVTGQRFWAQTTGEGQILDFLAAGRSPPGREKALGGVPPDLQYIIMNATEPDPVDRYESAAALQADLQVVLRRMAPSGFNHRDVGRRVGEIFADDRARLQSAIDTQLELVHGAGDSARAVPWLSAHSTAPPPRVADGAMPPDLPSSRAEGGSAASAPRAGGPVEPTGTPAYAGAQPPSVARAPVHRDERAAMQAAPRLQGGAPGRAAERDESPTTPRSLNIARRSGRASNLAVQSPPPSSGIAPLRAGGQRLSGAWLEEAPANPADGSPYGQPRSDAAIEAPLDDFAYADDSITPMAPTEINEPGHRLDTGWQDPFGTAAPRPADRGPSARGYASMNVAGAAGPAPSADALVAAAPDGLRDGARYASSGAEQRSLGVVATLPSVPIPILPSSTRASEGPVAAGTAVSIAPAGSPARAVASKSGRKQLIVVLSAIAGVVAALAVSSLRERGSRPPPAARADSSAAPRESAPPRVVAPPPPPPQPTWAADPTTSATPPTIDRTVDSPAAALPPPGAGAPGAGNIPGNAAGNASGIAEGNSWANAAGNSWGTGASHLGVHAADARPAAHAPVAARPGSMPKTAAPPASTATPSANAAFPTATAMPLVRPPRPIDVMNPYSP
jgi:serine/threonine-protein kinase